MKTTSVLVAMIAGIGPVMAQSADYVRFVDGRLEDRSNWFGNFARQHFSIENLTDRTLTVAVECGFKTGSGYTDGSGETYTLKPRGSVEGFVDGEGVSGKITETACTSSWATAP